MKKEIFLLLLLLIPIALAVEYPQPSNYVSDYANIISPEYEQRINQLAREIEKNTTVEIAVLTVDNLQGLDRETYAVEIFKQWGIGKKDIDNGLLILVALEERQYRIEVGYGLEPIITDARAGRIGRNNLVPNFQAGDYDKGIHEAILDIKGLIESDSSIISQYAKPDKTLPLTALFYPLILLFFFIGPLINHFTKKIESKKKKLGIKFGIGGIIFIALLFLSISLAIIVIFIYMLSLLPRRGMRGPGLIYVGGFGGGFRGGGGFGGGFGGFGGGFSGGGGAGGGW